MKLRSLLVAGGVAAMTAVPAFTFAAHATSVNPCVGTVACVNGSGDPTTQQGHLILQGEGGVPGPVGHGFIGVDSNEGVVGCANGTYNGATDNVISPIPPTAQSLSGLSNAGNNPCTPKP